MQKTILISFAAIAAIVSTAAIARNPVQRQPQTEGSGVFTDANRALVRPGFRIPGSHTLVKAGAASSTSCEDPSGYRLQQWAHFDTWGSFAIPRPANVVGEVRYCVSVRAEGAQSINVKYDVIGP
jgi:hypothetical protein